MHGGLEGYHRQRARHVGQELTAALRGREFGRDRDIAQGHEARSLGKRHHAGKKHIRGQAQALRLAPVVLHKRKAHDEKKRPAGRGWRIALQPLRRGQE